MLALVILASLAAIGLLLGHRGGARVVARAVTPDRAELCVVQQPSSDSPLWFKTSFVFRQPGGSWQRFYFHHEDRYWMGSRVSLDTNAQVATFSRGGLPALAFSWATGVYTNLQRHRPAAPQQMPVGWSPESPIP